MRRSVSMTVLLAVPLISLAQMGMGPGMGMMGGSSVRRAYVMRAGIDPRYANLTDPRHGAALEAAAGRKLYEADCAACHGAQGLGDGAAAKGLNPPPPSLAGIGSMPLASDGYLYWTITEGGAPVGSAMPPFKAALKPAQIWDLVAYLRSR